jgi:hypothetical protein
LECRDEVAKVGGGLQDHVKHRVGLVDVELVEGVGTVEEQQGSVDLPQTALVGFGGPPGRHGGVKGLVVVITEKEEEEKENTHKYKTN